MATRTIGTEIILQGEKQFNDAMKSVNNNLKNLKTDMARVTAEFDDNANSLESLTAKEKILAESVDQHRAKVDALKAMYDKQVEKYGENSAAADKYRQQLNQATVSLLKEERALNQTRSAMKTLKDEAENGADATSDLGNSSKRAEPKVKDLGNAVDNAGKSAEKASSRLSGIAGKLGSLAFGALQAGAAATALAAGFGVVAISSLVSFANESAESARAAYEAGEVLTESQKKWLYYAGSLDSLQKSAQSAKSALGSVLLPTLSRLSTSGAMYLNSFAAAMDRAGNDTERKSEVIGEYAKIAVRGILESLPEYANLGASLLRGVVQGFSGASPELADAGIDMVFDFIEAILSAAPEAGAGAEALMEVFLTALEERGPGVIVAAVNVLGGFVSGLIDSAGEIIPVAGLLILTLADELIKAIPSLFQTAADIIVGIGQYLSDPGNLAAIALKAWDIGKSIVDGIWQGIQNFWSTISEGLPGLVAAIKATMDFSVTGSFGSIPGAASGLDYVPYDNYLIRLHKGEKVLTAAEAAEYRSGKTGQTSKNFNLTINTQSLSKEDLDMIVAYVNGKLGDDL